LFVHRSIGLGLTRGVNTRTHSGSTLSLYVEEDISLHVRLLCVVVSSVKVRVIAERMLTELMAQALEAEGEIDIVEVGADVTVVDAAFYRGEWIAGVEDLLGGSNGAVVLLVDEDREDTAVAAARAGVVALAPPGVAIDELAGLIRTVAAGGGVYPERHLGAVLRALWSDRERAATTANRLSSLTERERHVLGLLVDGLTARDMAEQLGVSVNTVRTHTNRIFRKLGVHHRLEAVRVARSAGVVSGRAED
jgi:DNA-binding NarL/FixJ family response regulator